MISKHFTRPCRVVFKKPKLKLMDEFVYLKKWLVKPENSSYSGNALLLKWEEEKRKQIKKESVRLKSFLDKKILVEGASSDSYYYYIVAIERSGLSNLDTLAGTNASTDKFSTSRSLSRVISARVFQNVETASTATVVLDNFDDMFLFPNAVDKDQFADGDCIIEANDEVEIWLPDWNDVLKIALTGLVGKVSSADDGLNKVITIECEDMTKKLRISRTNVDPSLDIQEAEGYSPILFNSPWAGQTAKDAVRLILGRSLLDIFRDPGIVQQIAQDSDDYIELKGIEGREEDRAKLLQKMNDTLNRLILQAVVPLATNFDDVYTDDVKDYFSNVKSTENTVDGYVGYSFYPIIEQTLPPVSVMQIVDIDVKPKFIFTGSLQPIASIVLHKGEYNFVNSEWKSNDQIIQDMAQTCFFEFFADRLGVIRFRPMNLTLPMQQKGDTTDVISRYYITQANEIYVSNFSRVVDDSVIISDVIVQGRLIAEDYAHPLNRVLVSGPISDRAKYGVRIPQLVQRLQLVKPDALTAFGEQYLVRQNAQLYSGSLDMVGHGGYFPGNPIFIERWLSVYYITSITHNYVAGSDYTMNVSLKYGRHPIAKIDLIKNESIQRFIQTYDVRRFSYINKVLSDLGDSISGWEYDALAMGIYDRSLVWGVVTETKTGLLGLGKTTTKSALVWKPIPARMLEGQILARETDEQKELEEKAALQNQYVSTLVQIFNVSKKDATEAIAGKDNEEQTRLTKDGVVYDKNDYSIGDQIMKNILPGL